MIELAETCADRIDQMDTVPAAPWRERLRLDRVMQPRQQIFGRAAPIVVACECQCQRIEDAENRGPCPMVPVAPRVARGRSAFMRAKERRQRADLHGSAVSLAEGRECARRSRRGAGCPLRSRRLFGPP